MSSVKVHDREVTVERFTVAKAMRAITLFGLIQKQVPHINKLMAEFRHEYRRNNAIELDRVQAKMRFGPEPVLGDDGNPLLTDDGDVLTVPSPIDRMTAEDWERAGQVLRLPSSPSMGEVMFAVFPEAWEHAEQPVRKLLALIAMPNDQVSRHVAAGTIQDELEEYAREVIDQAYLEEVMELAAVGAEAFEQQVFEKAKSVGTRLGNLFGLAAPKTETETETSIDAEESTTSSEPAEEPNTGSVSLSPSDTGGTQEPSSGSRGTSSLISSASS